MASWLNFRFLIPYVLIFKKWNIYYNQRLKTVETGLRLKKDRKKNQFQYILDEVAESVNPDRDWAVKYSLSVSEFDSSICDLDLDIIGLDSEMFVSE